MGKSKQNKEKSKRAEALSLKGHDVAAWQIYQAICKRFHGRRIIAPTLKESRSKQAAIIVKLAAKRQEVYAQFNKTYGFDIPQQSTNNLQRLRETYIIFIRHIYCTVLLKQVEWMC